MIHRSLGNYENAESEYKIALNLAESKNDIFNKIRILNNLGYMHNELTEFDRALDYYGLAKELLEQFNKENYEYRINIIINAADVMAKQDKLSSVEKLLNEASSLVANWGSLPLRKADLLVMIGKFNLEIGKFQTALDNFQKAEFICNENGLLRMGLKTKIMLAKSMILLSSFSKAIK